MSHPLDPRAVFDRLASAATPAPSPAADTNASLVHRYYEMWNTGQGSVADQVLGPRYVDHAQSDVIGPAASRAIVPRFHRAYPDARITTEVVAADDEYVAVRNTIRKTHGGRAVEVVGTALLRIEAGRIAEQWSWYPGAKPGKFGLPKGESKDAGAAR